METDELSIAVIVALEELRQYFSSVPTAINATDHGTARPLDKPLLGRSKVFCGQGWTRLGLRLDEMHPLRRKVSQVLLVVSQPFSVLDTDAILWLRCLFNLVCKVGNHRLPANPFFEAHEGYSIPSAENSLGGIWY